MRGSEADDDGRAGTAGPRLTVAVLTFRRNTYLAELLPALMDQAAGCAAVGRARVLVVDNDPAAGAASLVENARRDAVPERLVYVHEPEPGIVAGRNRALAESSEEDLLVFIDDDELPADGWLDALVNTWRSTGCAAVTGPTPPVFEVQPDPWVRASGAFDSWDAPDGQAVRSADTGNLLLDLSVVRRLNLGFNPRYGLTGGEDSLFTRQLTLAGQVIRFSAAAVVTKRVPPARANRRWVLRRAYRSGSSWARVRIDTAPGLTGPSLRAGYAAKGIVKAVVDVARAGLAAGRGDVGTRARREVSSRGGMGMVVGAFDVRVREYGRPSRRRTS